MTFILSVLLVLPSCVKPGQPAAEPQEFRTVTTSVSGSVMHKYYNTPMGGVMVKVYSYREKPENFAYTKIIEQLDSTYTDSNGMFSMDFTHQDNAGAYYANKYYVYCPELDIDSLKEIYPNTSNTGVSLLFYVKPVLSATFTVTNITYPPIRINLPGGLIEKHVDGDTTYHHEMEPNANSSISCTYRDANDSLHVKYYYFTTGEYSDTFFHHFNIDAASF